MKFELLKSSFVVKQSMLETTCCYVVVDHWKIHLLFLSIYASTVVLYQPVPIPRHGLSEENPRLSMTV